jgi:biopolymer transport protein ExbD
MRLVRALPNASTVQLQMTSMIDIVFLLLVFFVMTFKIVVPEGDFQIHMAAQGGNGPADPEATPEVIRVRLHAAADGSLAGIEAEQQSLASFNDLRRLVLNLTSSNAGPSVHGVAPEIEFDVDPGLDYRHLMAALTAVKGYIGPRGEVIDLTDRIKILPQTRAM